MQSNMKIIAINMTKTEVEGLCWVMRAGEFKKPFFSSKLEFNCGPIIIKSKCWTRCMSLDCAEGLIKYSFLS